MFCIVLGLQLHSVSLLKLFCLLLGWQLGANEGHVHCLCCRLELPFNTAQN